MALSHDRSAWADRVVIRRIWTSCSLLGSLLSIQILFTACIGHWRRLRYQPAGSIVGGPAGDLLPRTWFDDQEVNVQASYILTHYYLKALGSVTIMLVGTRSASFTTPEMKAYLGSRMALLKLAEYLNAGEFDYAPKSLVRFCFDTRNSGPSCLHGPSWNRGCHGDSARHGC